MGQKAVIGSHPIGSVRRVLTTLKVASKITRCARGTRRMKARSSGGYPPKQEVGEMARISVQPIDINDDHETAPSMRAVTAEILCPVEHLQQRFDAAYDRAEELGLLIHSRQSRGFDCSELLGKLKQAEGEKRAALAALRKARWLKAIPAA